MTNRDLPTDPNEALAVKLLRAFDGRSPAEIQDWLRELISTRPQWDTEMLLGVIETRLNDMLRRQGRSVD